MVHKPFKYRQDLQEVLINWKLYQQIKQAARCLFLLTTNNTIHQRKVGLLDCWIVGLLDCWIVGLLNCWIVELLDCYIVEWWKVKTFNVRWRKVGDFSPWFVAHETDCHPSFREPRTEA